jgi:hypothetical protein
MLLTLIVPYYRQPAMLLQHLLLWEELPAEVRSQIRLLIVDDGSPEPAEPVVRAHPISKAMLYRIDVDIPWNRGGARNLGSTEAKTPWLMHVDIDHVLPYENVIALLKLIGTLQHGKWYRFRRFRMGAADETRGKDKADPKATFVEIKPHIDSYLISRDLYWRTGGYDEDYSGCLGGGSPFLRRLETFAPVEVLDIALHVYTRHVVPDSSVVSLSRDTSEYSKRRRVKEKMGNTVPKNPLRFPWSRVL